MEYFVLGDEDTVTGFRFAGVNGKAVATADEARAALAAMLAAGKAGVVIVTDRVAKLIGDEFDRLRFQSRVPLVVQIPGSEGPAADRPDLLVVIRDAMGIKF